MFIPRKPYQLSINTALLLVVFMVKFFIQDKSRRAILERKNRTKIGQSKGEVTSSLHENLANVD
jgi:hypothetical protein